MSLFKRGNYKMGGGGTKTKSSGASAAPAAKEHFQLINTSSPAPIQKSKSKAPPLPDANDATPRFRLTNKTAYNWKLKNSASLFPQELASGDNKLIKLKEKQAPVQAIYTIRIKDKGESEKTFEFQFKLAKNEGVYELLVDWMNLTSVKGIKLKPDSSSSNQPTKLGANEVTIEMDISS